MFYLETFLFDSVKLFFFLSPTSNFFATNAALHNNIMQATSSQILASQILKTMTNYTSKSYLQILFSNWKTKTKQNKKASKTLFKTMFNYTRYISNKKWEIVP